MGVKMVYQPTNISGGPILYLAIAMISGAPAHHAVIQAIFKHMVRCLTEAVQQMSHGTLKTMAIPSRHIVDIRSSYIFQAKLIKVGGIPCQLWEAQNLELARVWRPKKGANNSTSHHIIHLLSNPKLGCQSRCN